MAQRLKVLQDVGLGYLRLGQSATTLSGGEAQRVKTGGTFGPVRPATEHCSLFDEPTTGLHFDDIAKLLQSFERLIHNGGSVLLIEHNLELIKAADWIIDLGPEGGDRGGRIVAQGTPETVAGVAGILHRPIPPIAKLSRNRVRAFENVRLKCASKIGVCRLRCDAHRYFHMLRIPQSCCADV